MLPRVHVVLLCTSLLRSPRLGRARTWENFSEGTAPSDDSSSVVSNASQLLSAADALSALSIHSSVPWPHVAARCTVLSAPLLRALATASTGKFARMRFSVALSVAVYAATIADRATSAGEVARADETILSTLGVPLSLLITPESNPLNTKRITAAAIRQHAVALNIAKHTALTGESALHVMHACVTALFQLLRAASPLNSTRDELLHIARINSASPLNIRVLPTSGENERCFYEVIKYHFGWSHEQTAQKIVDATTTIKTVGDLAKLQFAIDPTQPLSSAEVAAHVADFLASPNFRDRKWAGAQEMCLLSRQTGGATAFLLVSDQCSKDDQPRYVGWLYPNDDRVQQLIIMHYGNFAGERRGIKNHYSTIVADVYGVGDAVPSTKWPGPPSRWCKEQLYPTYKAAGERYSSAVRAERDAMAALDQRRALELAAMPAVVLDHHPSTPPRATALRSPPTSQKRRRQITHHGLPQASYSAMNSGVMPDPPPSDEDARDPPPSRPTRGPSVRPNRMSSFPPAVETARALERAEHRAKTKPTPIEIVHSQPASAPYTPPQYRPRVRVDVPSTCRRHWVTLMQPWFELYGELSTQGHHDQCADVLQAILDMPGKVLIQGEPVRRTLQRIHQHTGVTVHSHQPAPTVTVDQVPPVAVPLPVTPTTPHSMAPTLSLHPTPDSVSTPIPIEAAAPDDHDGHDADGVDTSVPSSFVPPTLDADVIAQLASPPRMDECPTEGARNLATPPLDDTTRAVLRAVHIVRDGGPKVLQRAVKTLVQGSLASVTESVLTKLRSLHPPAGAPLADMPVDRCPSIGTVDQGDLFRLLKTRVNNGAAAGPSGWTGAHLQLIAENGSPEAQTGLTMMVKDICNGVFTGHMRSRLVASLLMPLEKRDGGVRPIACGEVFTKLAAHYTMSLIESRLPSLFPRIQFGVKKPGGSESAAQLTRAMIDQCRSRYVDTIGLKTDFTNAFNNADRAQMFERLLACDATDPILRMFHWAYAEESPLLVYDRGQLKALLASAQGVRQGDPFAAFAFALLVQRLYESAIAGTPDCHAVSVLDDLTSSVHTSR